MRFNVKPPMISFLNALSPIDNTALDVINSANLNTGDKFLFRFFKRIVVGNWSDWKALWSKCHWYVLRSFIAKLWDDKTLLDTKDETDVVDLSLSNSISQVVSEYIGGQGNKFSSKKRKLDEFAVSNVMQDLKDCSVPSGWMTEDTAKKLSITKTTQWRCRPSKSSGKWM